MNDKLIMENYLLVLKSTIEVYIHGTLESSNKDIRNLLKNGLEDTLNSQATTYDIMTQKEWYNVSNISPSSINETLNKIQEQN